jgi:hypothetical protein
MFAEKRMTGSGFGSGVLMRRGIMKNWRRVASVVVAVTLTVAVVAPANAAAWTVEDGACDGVAIRLTQYASTTPTTYAPCRAHGVNAKIQPAAAGGAHWTGWKWASGKAAYSTSGGILDSSHSVFE